LAKGREFTDPGKTLLVQFGGRPDEEFQCAVLDLLGLAGIDKAALGKDEGARRENLGLPAVRKAEVHNWCGDGGGHGVAL
jgi:hypothetical protein